MQTNTFPPSVPRSSRSLPLRRWEPSFLENLHFLMCRLIFTDETNQQMADQQVRILNSQHIIGGNYHRYRHFVFQRTPVEPSEPDSRTPSKAREFYRVQHILGVSARTYRDNH